MKRTFKKITSLLIVFSIIINMLPQFGLLNYSFATYTGDARVVFEVDESYGIKTVNGNKLIKVVMSLNNIIADETVWQIKVDMSVGTGLTPASSTGASTVGDVNSFLSDKLDCYSKATVGSYSSVSATQVKLDLRPSGTSSHITTDDYGERVVVYSDPTPIFNFYFIVDGIDDITDIDDSVIGINNIDINTYGGDSCIGDENGQVYDDEENEWYDGYIPSGEVYEFVYVEAQETPKKDLKVTDFRTAANEDQTTTYTGNQQEYATNTITGAGTITTKYYKDNVLVTDTNNQPIPPTDAGTYTVKVSATGGETYNATTSDLLLGTLTINKKDPIILDNNSRKIYARYGQTLQYVQEQGTENGLSLGLAGLSTKNNETSGKTQGTFYFDDGTDLTTKLTTAVGATSVDVTNYKVKFVPSDTTNYNTLTGQSLWIVEQKGIPDCPNPIELTIEYGKSLQDIEDETANTWGLNHSSHKASDVSGTYTFTGVSNKSNTYPSPADSPVSYQATYSTSNTNYTTRTVTVNITVEKGVPSNLPSEIQLDATYGQTLSDLVSALQAKNPSNGTYSFKEALSTEVGNATGTSYVSRFTAVYTPSSSYADRFKETEIPVKVKVAKADPTVPSTSGLTAVYGQKLSDVDLSILDQTNGTFSWYLSSGQTASNTSVGNVGDNTFTLKYTPNNTTNYNTKTVDTTVTVSQAEDPNYTKPTGLTATYGDTLSSVTLPAGFAWVEAGTTPVGDVGNRDHNVVYTPTNSNYGTKTDKVTIAVSKATPTYTKPTGLTAVYGSKVTSISLASFNTADGTFTWAEDATKLVGNAGTNKFNVKYTPSDTANYETLDAIEVNVVVTKANLTESDLNVSGVGDFTYTPGTTREADVSIKPAVKAKGTGDITQITYNDSTTKPQEKGEYTVKVIISEGTNYNAATITLTDKIVISSAELKASDFTITPTEVEYDGSNHTPTVAIKDGVTGAGSISSVTYKKANGNGAAVTPKNVGTYNVYVATTDGTNYDAQSEIYIGDFTITKSHLKATDIELTFNPSKTKEYNGQATTATANVKSGITGAGTDITVSYYKNNTKVTETKEVGTYEVRVAVSEGTSYEAFPETTIDTFEITKVTLTKEDLTYTAFPQETTYNGNAKSVTVTAPTGAGAVTVKYYQGTTEVTNPTNAGDYTVKASVAEGTNYKALAETELGTLTITKADLTANNFDVTLNATSPKEYDGTELKVSNLQYKSGLTGTANISGATIKYYKKTGSTTFEQVTATSNKGSYEVRIDLPAGTNYKQVSDLKVAEFEITGIKLDNNAYVVNPSTVTYDGNTHPVTVTINASTNEGTISNIRYKDSNGTTSTTAPTNAGEYTIIVNKTEGENTDEEIDKELSTKLKIEKATLTTDNLNLTIPESRQYNGQASTATASVKSGITGAGAVTVSYYKNNTKVTDTKEVGTYIVKVEVAEGSNYKALTIDNAGTFTISKADLADADISVTNPGNKTYDGTPITDATASIPGKTGVGAITVKYVNGTEESTLAPTNAGTYTIKVEVAEGANYNAKTVENAGTFTISKADLTEDDFDKTIPATKVYNGQASSATASIKNTVVGAGNITAIKYNDSETAPSAYGDYTVYAVVAEGTNYKAGTIEIGSFSITKNQLKNTDFNFEAPTSLVYDGNEKEATVTGKSGVDGTITVKYNGSTTKPVNAGTYTVTVDVTEGTNFASVTGLEVGSFEITKADLANTDINVTNPGNKEYNGDASTASATIPGKTGYGTITVKYVNGTTESTTAPTDAGTYTIKVEVAEGTNYKAITIADAGSFTISKANLADADISVTNPGNKDYDGTPIADATATIPGKTGYGTITVKYVNGTEESTTAPTAAGTYTIKVEVAEGTNYNAKTIANAGTFTINKANPDNTSISKITITYGEKLAGKLPTRNDGTYTWNADENAVYNASDDEYTFTATFTPSDTTNYNTINGITVKVKVNKAIPTYTIPNNLEGYEGQPLSLVTNLTDGFSWDNENQILPQISVGGTTYTAKVTYTPSDTTNYEVVPDISVTVNVKANEVTELTITSAPSAEDATYYEGQTFDISKMVVTASFVVGDPQDVTSDCTVDPAGALTGVGDKDITISYGGKSVVQRVTVIADFVKDFTLVAPSKLEYNYGDAINLAGAKLTTIWASELTSKQETIDVTKDMLSSANISDFDHLNVVGNETITVSYGAATKEFQIRVNDFVTGISIDDITSRLQTEYIYGDTINVTDKDTGDTLNVTVNYASGHSETKPLTTSMVKGFSMTTVADNQTVTVETEGFSATYTINVKDQVIGIDVTKEPSKRIYKLDAAVNFSDMVIKYVMKSGADGDAVTDYTVSAVDTSTVGEKQVTVTKDGFQDTFKIKVINVATGMSISNFDKTTYLYGESLDLANAEITIAKQDGVEVLNIANNPDTIKVTGYNPNQLGEQTVTVTYIYDAETAEVLGEASISDTITVTVEDAWSGNIKVTSNPDKTRYKYGEELELDGAKVAKLMLSGATIEEVDITGEMVSGYVATKEGKQTITVTYVDKTTTFEVTVVDEVEGISIKTEPNKKVFEYGQRINTDGGVLNVTKTSGIKEVAITADMISGYDPRRSGQQLVTVNYGGKTAQYLITVNEYVAPPVETYTVTFEDYDGTVITTVTEEKGTVVTAPEAPVREGYVFIGWSKELEDINEDTKVIAQYRKIVRAKVETKGNIEVEKGEKIDLTNVTLVIYDEEEVETERMPVTEDMISGFDSNKVGRQLVTVIYISDEGEKFEATFEVRVVSKTVTLAVTDSNNNGSSPILPIIAVTATGSIVALFAAFLLRKNIEIYAIADGVKKLLGKQKISRTKVRIDLNKYSNDIESGANFEIVIKEEIANKFDGREIEVAYKGKISTYTIRANGQDFIIRKNNI